jgi:hypothetical protein
MQEAKVVVATRKIPVTGQLHATPLDRRLTTDPVSVDR